jgi:hypothetical protein
MQLACGCFVFVGGSCGQQQLVVAFSLVVKGLWGFLVATAVWYVVAPAASWCDIKPAQFQGGR